MADKKNSMIKSAMKKGFSFKSPLSYINPLSLQGSVGLNELVQLMGYSGLYKDGGRVRGCKIAKRGFGKVMKRKK